MKNCVFLLIVAVATLFISSPILVGAESCSSGEGECANPDVDDPEIEVAAEASPPVEAEEDTPPVAVEEDPNCPSRELIIRCAGKHLDHNKNGKLDRDELQGAIDSLPWYARGILQILGSVDKMVSVCVLFLSSFLREKKNPSSCIYRKRSSECFPLLFIVSNSLYYSETLLISVLSIDCFFPSV